MSDKQPSTVPLPTWRQVHQAVEIYLRHAYGGEPPEPVRPLLPPEGLFDPAAWIMNEQIERDPPSAPLEIVRSAGFRLGNTFYPHMKLRLSRPPSGEVFLFSVDAHDAILQAKPGTPDYAMLEELKAQNARIAQAILAEWDRAGLPTERNYLRRKVEQAKRKNPSSGANGSRPGDSG